MGFFLSAIDGYFDLIRTNCLVNMIDASNPNYSETLRQIDELRSSMEGLDSKFFSEIPQGLKEEFDSSKGMLFHWIEEIEFTLQEYNRSK